MAFRHRKRQQISIKIYCLIWWNNWFLNKSQCFILYNTTIPAQFEPAETGRPAYDPQDLLKLYIYGYLNRIRTSRNLMRECGRNIELFWLFRMLQPDFRTVADFRKDNRKALRDTIERSERYV
jgi:hypothetical protein